jgi:hypothetical protein
MHWNTNIKFQEHIQKLSLNIVYVLIILNNIVVRIFKVMVNKSDVAVTGKQQKLYTEMRRWIV